MDVKEKALQKHYEWHGKIEVITRAPINSREDLSLAYTPGVAQPCLEIVEDENKSFDLTRRSNLVAVITDGTAVLGLGDIGPVAAMPVMEGKCALFKRFGGVDAIPLCVDTQDTDKLVETIRMISKSFGGINLEDISAPRCFEVERRLKECCDIPVFHDDQHGTAIVVGAAALNALKLTGRSCGEAHIVINGAGAAGISIARHLLQMNLGLVTLCDKDGIIHKGYPNLTHAQAEMAAVTNLENRTGSLADALKGADVFIGVSRPGLVSRDMVASMNRDAIVFAMANPTPEIMPDQAKAGGARVVGTGRSDYPNQINNILAFPGIFKGALAVRASDITDPMKVAASKAIASLINDEHLSEDNIIPDAFDPRVAGVVADAVANKAKNSGLARI